MKRRLGEGLFPRVGIWLREGHDGQIPYMLAQVERNKMVLIRLIDGNRWTAPCTVEDWNKVSLEEWKALTFGTQFTYLPPSE